MIFSLKYSKITSQDVIFGAVDRMSTGSFFSRLHLEQTPL